MEELPFHIENLETAVALFIASVLGIWGIVSGKFREWWQKFKGMGGGAGGLVLAVAITASGCGFLSSADPTVKALRPVLMQVAERVAKRGLELSELPAECAWEQSVDDADKLLVMCEVDTMGRK